MYLKLAIVVDTQDLRANRTNREITLIRSTTSYDFSTKILRIFDFSVGKKFSGCGLSRLIFKFSSQELVYELKIDSRSDFYYCQQLAQLGRYDTPKYVFYVT